MLERLPVAAAVADPSDGMILFANSRFDSLIALRAGGAIGTRLQSWFGPGFVIEDLQKREGDLECVRADGSRATVLASLASIAFRDHPDALCLCLYDVTELRRTERALAEQATFPELNPGPVCRMDRAGIVMLANEAARVLFGETALLGKCWLEICPEMSPETWDSILAGKTIPPMESQFSGSWVSFTHVRSANGKYVHVYGTDITARRNAEQKIAEQAAAFAEIARFPEMNPGPVIRTDLSGKMLLANSAARAVFGEDLLDRNWRESCPGLDSKTWEKILSANAVVPLEIRVGEREFIFNHRRDHRGSLVFVFGADVTPQKMAEKALRQTEKMATLGTLAAGVAHELNNPAAAARRSADQLTEALAQFEASQLALARQTLSPDGREALEEVRAMAREASEHRLALDTMARSDREASIEEWLEKRGIPDPAAIAPSLAGIGLEKQALDRIAARVGESALPAALAWSAAAAPVYALVHEIGHSSARISEIVKALSSYSYLGQAPIQLIDLREGLDSTLVILRHKLKAGITVRLEYDETVPRVPAYGSELNQVWTNLIDNAAEAMCGKGDLTIRTRGEGSWAVVEIEDHGPGIPESIQSRIFDPFFTTKPPGKGTGLGLSTSYGIVKEKHGGEIRVESRPGFTRFTVLLPIQEGQGIQKP